eukprot:m.115450 g.115450  ORF g.115450 m.115450 type:complete len:410 (+) comp10878_c0_seq1:474-1703(+)
MVLNMKIADVVADETSADAARARKLLEIKRIKDAIPAEAFEKSLLWSMWYLVFDYACIGASMYGLYTLKSSGVYDELPLAAQCAATLLHWGIAGFFMWCIFVVGHDCGHGTFSDYEWLNDILGHVCHGSIMVPYWPWRLSHKRHHMYHNHVDKDYSHSWVTPERMADPESTTARFSERNPWIMPLVPFVGWPLYLLGMPDGSHWIPLPGVPFKRNRLWESTSVNEMVKCIVSTAVVVAWVGGLYAYVSQDAWTLFQFYFAPVLVFGWWIVCVTYLQHHSPDSVVYGDDNWKFTLAAFETVDRKFGYGIDRLHHHITDGHVVHHLFFTKIPHYNLPIATKALVNYLKEHEIESVYKYEDTTDFPIRLNKYLIETGFKAVQLRPGQPVPAVKGGDFATKPVHVDAVKPKTH